MEQHANVASAKETFGRVFYDYFSFTFIRNPWDRMVSWYFWDCHQNSYNDSFEAWVDEVVFKTLQGDTRWRQDVYVDVDFIGRFESLREDLSVVFCRFGLEVGDIPMEKSGIRPDVHYRDMFSKRQRDLVYENFNCFDYRY